MAVLFYSVREEPYGCFSNFSAHGINLHGRWWPTVEHYFQSQKFFGTEYVEQVRRARTPKDAANIGRRRDLPLRRDWEKVKDEIMYRAVRAKFQEHSGIRAILLATGNEEIIENAPGDYYWGIGADYTGKNMLGKILMQVREELRSQES